MGCTSSIYDKQMLYPNTSKRRNKKRLLITKFAFDNTCIGTVTAEERMIVTKTWKIMAKDLPGNGLQVFLRIFEIAPDVKKLFSIEHERHSDVVRNVMIRSHASRFMQAIGAAVDRINDLDRSNDLDRLLHCLGQQHTHYVGFSPDFFEVFYEALMWQWERNMDKTFTQEVADAWSHVFAYVMWRLKEGYFGSYDDNDFDSGCRMEKYSVSSDNERQTPYVKRSPSNKHR